MVFFVDGDWFWRICTKWLACMVSLYTLAVSDTPSNLSMSWMPRSELARGGSLIIRRWLSLVVNREPLLFNVWSGERLDVLARGLLLGVASQNFCALPLFDVSLECDAVVPMHSPSAPASARVSDCDGFS